MIIKAINKDSIDRVWEGQLIEPNGYYIVSSFEENKWANSDQVLADIIAGKLVINDGTKDLTGSTDQINYLKGISPSDSDGAPMSRLKLATSGWTIQDHYFELTTCTLNSIYSKKQNNVDFNFCTMKFYENVNGVETEITSNDQSDLDARCIKTVIDWTPTFDYDVLGGNIKSCGAIVQDTRLWIVGVPDWSEQYAGSKEMVSGGKNLKYYNLLELDGKVVKHMTYSPYNTNKIRFIVRTPVAGYKTMLACTVLFYKS